MWRSGLLLDFFSYNNTKKNVEMSKKIKDREIPVKISQWNEDNKQTNV